MVEATHKPASVPVSSWVRTPCSMNLDQYRLAQLEETSSRRRRRTKKIESKYCSRTEAGVLRLVKRDRLALGVHPTRTSFYPVEVETEFAVARMVSLVREFRTRAESSTMSFLLTSVDSGVMSGAALACGCFLVAVYHW